MIGVTRDSMNEAYYRLYQMVKVHGHPVSPRALKCVEVRPAYLTLRNASAGLYTGESRRLNYRFFAIETLSYLAGWGDEVWHAELLYGINSQMKRFRNKRTGLFDGAYGPRLFEGLHRCYSSLRHDPDTRRAVASIWSPQMQQSELDTPCTLSLNFYRDVAWDHPDDAPGQLPRLGMTATMRSNDLNWGTPYDVAAFCAIQCTMAGALGWGVGTYTHVANSLHYYEDHPPTVAAPAVEEYRAVFLPDLSATLYRDALDWGDIVAGANCFLKDAYEHRESGRPWEFFKSSLENVATHTGRCAPAVIATYWAEWASIIRWSWTSGE